MRFEGVMTALITPFTRSGQLDEACFRNLVRRQLEAGITGLVPCGTTGETPTLSADEQDRLIRWTLDEAAGSVPVMAGVGSNNTAASIARAARAVELGVDGLLVAAPAYNKPTQEGLFLHYQAIAESQPETAVCIYDVPGRSAVAVAPSTMARLTQLPNVRIVKDATADLAKAAEIRRVVPDTVALLSGDDFTFLPHLAVGGNGCVSVASNLIPERMVALYRAFKDGDHAAAARDNATLQPFFRALFVQTNPLPIKAAMAHVGLCEEVYRLPLCPMGAAERELLVTTLGTVGVGPRR